MIDARSIARVLSFALLFAGLVAPVAAPAQTPAGGDVPLSGRGTDARLEQTDRVGADERKRARKARREQQP